MFETVRDELGIAGEMEIVPGLEAFMKFKKSRTAQQEQFAPMDELTCLDQEVSKLYRIKLEEKMDEFDESFAMSGKDQNFYKNIFYPSALLKTYMKVHYSTEVSECLEDCFTLGSGSCRDDLIPEVTGVCQYCIKDHFEDMDSDLSSINLIVLRSQIKHEFGNPKLSQKKCPDVVAPTVFSESSQPDLSDPALIVSTPRNGVSPPITTLNTFQEQEQVGLEPDAKLPAEDMERDTDLEEFSLYNPFSSNSVHEEEIKIYNPFLEARINKDLDKKEVKSGYSCDICGKIFSQLSYIDMHMTLFHSNRVLLKYVDSAETMMTTFHKESSPRCRRPKVAKKKLDYK
jgi:hypothetical protein